MAPSDPDYEYDIFFSYKRHDESLDWTRRVAGKLRYWVSQELNREVRMFVDEDDILTGQKWPRRLQEALQRSSCMICVWSPMYFQSDWCFSEWRSFREREKLLELQAHDLIAPLKYHDGEHFPDEARNVQWTDVSSLNSTLPAFWSSARALELEDRLKAFSATVAGMVRSAPAYRADWPVVQKTGLVQPKIELAKL